MDLRQFPFGTSRSRLHRGLFRPAWTRLASIACAVLLAMATGVPIAAAQGVGISRDGSVRFASGHILVAPRDDVADADFEAA